MRYEKISPDMLPEIRSDVDPLTDANRFSGCFYFFCYHFLFWLSDSLPNSHSQSS